MTAVLQQLQAEKFTDYTHSQVSNFLIELVIIMFFKIYNRMERLILQMPNVTLQGNLEFLPKLTNMFPGLIPI